MCVQSNITIEEKSLVFIMSLMSFLPVGISGGKVEAIQRERMRADVKVKQGKLSG